MTDRPILFSGPMVRALLEGRKTQTRRVMKLAGRYPDFCGGGGRQGGDWDDPTCWGWEDGDQGDWVTLEKEPGQRMGWRDWAGAPRVGDRFWVREAHAFVPRTAYRGSIGTGTIDQQEHPTDGYSAALFREGFDRSGAQRWRPSIHMPRWASRLTLTVTDVRVQRVQDISEADAIAEGSQEPSLRNLGGDLAQAARSERQVFQRLWDSLNGPRGFGWDRRPWVAAYTFAVERRNIDQEDAA